MPESSRDRIEAVFGLISACGTKTAQWFHHDECFQFPNAERWLTFCGTIPAFAFAIIQETLAKNSSPLPTAAHRLFFQAMEDRLYDFYKENRNDNAVQIRQCLLLESEFSEVCAAFKTNGDTWVSMDSILGVILPKRLATYQRDWGSALVRLAQGHRDANFSDYAAMRLAADLTGIVTPSSLVGHTAFDFGIEKYGSASIVLTEFAVSYMQTFP